MEFEFKMDIGDLLTFGTILVTLIVYVLTQKENNKVNRATFLQGYNQHFYGDPELSKLFLDIDYDKFIFNSSELGTEKEIRIWKLLDLLNNIGFHYQNKTIKEEDINMTTLGYAIVRVYMNDEIKKYLDNVDQHTDKVDEKLKAFGYFRILARKLNSNY